MRGLRVDPERLAGLSEAERSAVLDELRLVEAAFRENPLLGYWPHGKQVVFHSRPHPPLRAFFGGNRSGKTTAVVVDSIFQAIDGDLLPEHLAPFKRWAAPFYCRFVIPDLTGHLDGVLLQKIREWCPTGQLKGGSVDRAWDKVNRVLKFKNGSWFQVFSNDQDLDKFGGAALHRVVFDEEPREDLRRECLMRLIDFGGEELYAMTPLHGMSWVFDEIYEPWERGKLSGDSARVVVVDMDDNPHLDRTTMDRVLAGLSAEEREARKSGRFVSFAGLVFPQFSSAAGGHVIPSAPVPTDDDGRVTVEVFAGIDPGVRHMCAVVYAYLDELDRMVVFDEIAMQGSTVRQVCAEVAKRNSKWGVVPRWYVIDPSSRNKNHQTGRSDQQEFSDHGVPTIPGQNSVSAGINRMRERLDADRLHVMAHCTELRGEFKRYRWASNNRTENEARESPVKKDDHLLDALRYICMQRPLVPEHLRDGPSVTMKDRLLRHHLKQLDSPRVPSHPSGSGIFA